MQMLRVVSVAAVCAALSACSSGGINGRVTVAGGSASGIAVFAYGPTSGAAVTGSDGAFTLTGLDDGDYVLRAAVSGTDEGEQSAAVTVKGGKPSGDVTLAFHFSSGTLTGHVTFSDGSDATGLSVIASGPETKSAATEAGGAFTLSNLKSGAYIVSVEAPNTREGRVSIGAVASGSVDVGELRLTPVGRLAGTVTYNAMAAAGVAVTVPGTSVSSVTDATGAFELVNVPTGARTVLARTGEAPFWRSASADVTVARGDNAAVDLALSDDPPKTGTVNGVVTFFSPNDPTKITVEADGSSVSTAVTASGSFSLAVPVGTWDIVASAPSYPKLVLGHVVVHEGETINLPGQRLSWFRPIWTIDEQVVTLNPMAATQAGKAYQLLTVGSNGGSSLDRLALLDLETGDLRFLAAGGAYTYATISRTGKYVAWMSNNTVMFYAVATGALTSVAMPASVGYLYFPSDELALFVYLNNGSMRRISTATPTNLQAFPADGGVMSLYPDGDRWFVYLSGTPGSITQVTSTTDRTLPWLTAASTDPVLSLLTDAGSNFSLTLLPVDGGAPVSAGSVQYGTSVSGMGGTSSTPCFYLVGTEVGSFCVKMTDGSRVALPSDVTGVSVNELGTRIAFVSNPTDGGAKGFYESALPPTGALSPIDTSTAGWNVSWLTPTRVMAIELGIADGRKLRLVSNGTAAPVDTDTADGGINVTGPLVETRQKSTGQWRALLGDGTFHTLPVDGGVAPNGFGVRTGSPTTRYAAVSFALDSPWSWILDETAGSVTALPYGGVCSGGFRSGTLEFTRCTRDGISTTSMPYDFQRKMFVDEVDETISGAGYLIGTDSVRMGRVAISYDGHSLLLGTFGE